MKHYAYHNMSRRTQLTTKFVFQVTSQISENFIFIYLGLSLFTDDKLDYKPLFILITVAGICAARWCAVFPLSRIINAVTRYRQQRRGEELVEEIPYAHQAMIYWAGLRGAVGVALAAGLTGNNGDTLRATVLVVVVLTVIIFGGTTARMLEILGIRTGVVDEIDSDDEFDIEVVNGGTYTRNKGQAYGHTPRPSQNGFTLNNVNEPDATYSSGSFPRNSPPTRPNGGTLRRNSSHPRNRDGADQGLLSPHVSGSDDEDDIDLDLPPSARRSPARGPSPLAGDASPYPTSGIRPEAGSSRVATAAGAVKQLFDDISHDPANAFKQIDDGFLKPHLLLDQGKGPGPNNV
jgi:sodium/hydrogen exchanger-like protein 6/7